MIAITPSFLLHFLSYSPQTTPTNSKRNTELRQTTMTNEQSTQNDAAGNLQLVINIYLPSKGPKFLFGYKNYFESWP
jgi:hypothetical protein